MEHKDIEFNYYVDKLLERTDIDESIKDIIDVLKKEHNNVYPIKVIEDFETKTPSKPKKEEYQLVCGKKVPIYTIDNMHDLIQFVGYGKYINSKYYNVYMRGQTDLYHGTMIPSLYRGGGNNRIAYYKFSSRMNEILRTTSSFKKYERNVFEPMIQHYGIKTTMIDLVDNVWIALWFGLHNTHSVIMGSREHIFISDNDGAYAYIVLMATDAVQQKGINGGIYEGKNTILVDLRKVLPSYFLRPHAQHALMLKKKELNPGIEAEVRADSDYSDLIVGIARIPVGKGFEWIGRNRLLSTSGLFPSAYFDYGYRILLEKYPLVDKGTVNHYGSIQIIGE